GGHTRESEEVTQAVGEGADSHRDQGGRGVLSGGQDNEGPMRARRGSAGTGTGTAKTKAAAKCQEPEESAREVRRSRRENRIPGRRGGGGVDNRRERNTHAKRMCLLEAGMVHSGSAGVGKGGYPVRNNVGRSRKRLNVPTAASAKQDHKGQPRRDGRNQVSRQAARVGKRGRRGSPVMPLAKQVVQKGSLRKPKSSKKPKEEGARPRKQRNREYYSRSREETRAKQLARRQATGGKMGP
ncbi:hypothetical protein FOL47_000798, partial [Perkinsus chesapeaki]